MCCLLARVIRSLLHLYFFKKPNGKVCWIEEMLNVIAKMQSVLEFFFYFFMRILGIQATCIGY